MTKQLLLRGGGTMEILILISIVVSTFLILKKLNNLIDKQGQIMTDLNRVQVKIDENDNRKC